MQRPVSAFPDPSPSFGAQTCSTSLFALSVTSQEVEMAAVYVQTGWELADQCLRELQVHFLWRVSYMVSLRCNCQPCSYFEDASDE